MNFRRFLSPESIRLDLETRCEPPDAENDPDFEPFGKRNTRRVTEEVIEELAGMLDAGGRISNPRRLCRNLIDREKRVNTALGQGLAIPHVRTMQAKSFTMAFGRSREGLPFDAPDEARGHLFFAWAAPPHDDRTYLKVYKSLAEALLDQDTIDELMSIEDPSEVLRILRQFGG